MAIGVVSPTETIVRSTVEDAIVSEDGVVSIEEEGKELIFEVGKDVVEKEVVGSFVVDFWVVGRSEGGEEVVKGDKVVCEGKVVGVFVVGMFVVGMFVVGVFVVGMFVVGVFVVGIFVVGTFVGQVQIPKE